MLQILNAPQSEIDWITNLFVTGLDVIPDSPPLPTHLHLQNYPSATQYISHLKTHYMAEVAAGNMLRTKIGHGPTPARVCPLAYIPKSDELDKFPDIGRPLTDATAPAGFNSTNSVNKPPHFKMTSHIDILTRSDSKSWGAKTDIKAAFRNMKLNPAHAGWLAVEIDGYYYWELRAPFGWSLAPFSWCKLTDFIQRFCAHCGYNILCYVDDFIHIGPSENNTLLNQQFLLRLIEILGLTPKLSKSVAPTKILTCLGFVFDFTARTVAISSARANTYSSLIRDILAAKKVKLLTLQSLVGKLVFASQVVAGGRCFSRRLHDAVASFKGKLSPSAIADLQWWLKYLTLANGKHVLHWSLEPGIRKVTADASNIAAGGVHGSNAWAHAWNPAQLSWHINIKELWAALHCFKVWSHLWRDCTVVFGSDNSSVVAWLNSGTAKSTFAMLLLRKIYWLQATFNISVEAVWIPTALNVAADALSRLDFNTFLSSTTISLKNVDQSNIPHILIPYTTSIPYAYHEQTLGLLNKKYPIGLRRVYPALWQPPHLLHKGLDGIPSFGFAWPTSGLPALLLKRFSCILPLGCTSRACPMALSVLTSLLSPRCLPTVGSNLPLEAPLCPSWQGSCKGSVDPLAILRTVSYPLPSSCSLNFETILTSVTQQSWHIGQHSRLVYSPSFDPVTWYLSLKELGNVEHSLDVLMSILLSSVPCFLSISQRHSNSWKNPSGSKYPISLAPLSAQSPPFVPSTPSVPYSQAPLCSLGLLTPQLPMTPSDSSLRNLPPNVDLTHNVMPVTALGVEGQQKHLELAPLLKERKPKACGNQMLYSATSTCLRRSNGPFLC